MRKNRKQNIRLLTLILILLLGIGFAALATTLKIDGIVNVSKSNWDVHFENVQITEGSVTANPAPTSDDTTTTEMTYTTNFTKPGDYFEFTVDIVNDGTIDAMVDVVSNNAYQDASSTTPITLPTYLTSTVTYEDGVEIQPNQELLHNTREKIKVRVEFKKDIEISDLPSDGNKSIVFKFKADYKQKNKNAKEVRKTYTAGDSVELEGEEFYFIDQKEDGTVLLLTKYGLINNGNESNPQWIQNSNQYDYSYTTSFSSTVYWHEEAWLNQRPNTRTGGTLDNYYDDYYMMNFNRGGVVDQAKSSYVYRTKNNQDTNNNIYPIINNYKSQLKSKLGIDNIDARLISVYEAIKAGCSNGIYECEEWIASEEYWTGSTDDYECDDCIYTFYHDNGEYYIGAGNNSNSSQTIRPIVEMSKIDFINKIEASNN